MAGELLLTVAVVEIRIMLQAGGANPGNYCFVEWFGKSGHILSCMDYCMGFRIGELSQKILQQEEEEEDIHTE